MENLHFNTSIKGFLSVLPYLSLSVPVCLSTIISIAPLHCDVTFYLPAYINLLDRQMRKKYEIMTRYCFFNRFMMQKPSSLVGSYLTKPQKQTCLYINQHLLFVGNSFLSSDLPYNVYFRIYGGSKEFHAMNF